MILITCNEWVGPSRERTLPNGEVTNKLVSFASRLPLEEALRALRAYERAYCDRYIKVLAVNFTILAVSQIQDLSDSVLDMMRIAVVENMEIT